MAGIGRRHAKYQHQWNAILLNRRGADQLIALKQEPDLDYGDWLSTPCPTEVWHVQDAVGCEGQVADISPESPESINLDLDVIGYNIVPEDFGLSLNTAESHCKKGQEGFSRGRDQSVGQLYRPGNGKSTFTGTGGIESRRHAANGYRRQRNL